MPRQVRGGSRDWTGRVQRGTAVLVTVLLHLLLVLLVTLPPPITTATPPRGEANGSRMEVTLLDQTLPPAPPEPVPAVRKPASIKKPNAPRPIKRPLSTPIVQATVPMPPEAADTADTSTAAPAPPDAQADNTVFEFSARARTDDAARANAALAAKLGARRSRDDSPPATGPSIGVDGFHVYYELADENLLRAWRHQGMTELFLPLPGTRRLMVCPLEIALRRGSGKCRMVEMDSPELRNVGDAREVINIARVYQWGEMVWSGPGPYR